jgi:hypothetical protein
MAASIYKTIKPADKTSQKTVLHESIPITGSLVSGTYGTWPDDTNVKFYSHGYFQSVYDYPYLSSSANHMFDLSFGLAPTYATQPSASGEEGTIKNAIWNQMSQVTYGYDPTGSIIPINRSGSLTPSGVGLAGPIMEDIVVINFSRLLAKDEIKKESFSMVLGTGNYATPFDAEGVTLSDLGASTAYKNNSPLGEYSILYSGSTATSMGAQGLLFYQAGFAVVAGAAVFSNADAFASSSILGTQTYENSIVSQSCDDLSSGLRRRIQNISFNNTTELNSSIYFCKVDHGDFNYSSNPTYVSGSKIRVKETIGDSPMTYITTVGLYSEDNELLAVAKLSEPIKNSATDASTFRVRLDY